MDFTHQDVVHFLTAPSGAFPHNVTGIYLLHEEDNDLSEKLWNGLEITDEIYIASDVKTNTPAVYLLDEAQRLVFYLHAGTNAIRCSRYNDHEKTWEDVIPEAGSCVAYPSSKMSGCFTANGQIVFFQNSAGVIQGIRVQGSTWESFSAVPAVQLLEGSPHALLNDEEGNLHFFYIGLDKALHHLAEGVETGTWEDQRMISPVFDEEVIRFLVMPDISGAKFSEFEILLLTGGKLAKLSKSGERTDLGTVTNGIFTVISTEENGAEALKLVVAGVKALCGSGKGK